MQKVRYWTKNKKEICSQFCFLKLKVYRHQGLSSQDGDFSV